MYHGKKNCSAEQAIVIIRFSLSTDMFGILLPEPQNKVSQF